MTRSKTVVVASLTGVLAAAALAGTGSATATEKQRYGGSSTDRTFGWFEALNSSGVTGWAKIHTKGKHIKVEYRANGLAANLPHAAHIHHDEQARHECPTIQDDTNGDFRLNVVEGLPAYGGIARSLTTRGDTSPASALAVDRFPTAGGGKVRYHRHLGADHDLAKAVRRGEAVIVLHGVDYNGNGEYDLDSAGASELDESLPAEATDPAACVRLR